MPERKFVLVEYPGIIKENVQKALDTLNFTGKDEVELKYSNTEAWRPILKGDKVKTTSFLLKVPKGQSLDKGKIIGKISEAVRFRRLTDFAIVPPEETEFEQTALDVAKRLDLSEIEQLARMLSNEEFLANSRQDVLEYAPLLFTPSYTPFWNAIEGATSRGFNYNGSSGTHRKGKEAPWNRFFTDSRPVNLPITELVIRSKRLYRSNYEAMINAFEERPVWTRAALSSRFPSINMTEMRTLLPAIAYFFVDGPWRICWVRLGYDPRITLEAHIYQVLEIRDSKIQSIISALPSALRKEALSSSSHVFDGARLLANLGQFQYCDLTFESIKSFLLNEKLLKDNCDKREGWYVPGTIKQLRIMIKDRWIELLGELDATLYAKVIKSKPQDKDDDEQAPDEQVSDEQASDDLDPSKFVIRNNETREEEEGDDFEFEGFSEYEIYE